jgi:hypothetical protein
MLVGASADEWQLAAAEFSTSVLDESRTIDRRGHERNRSSGVV